MKYIWTPQGKMTDNGEDLGDYFEGEIELKIFPKKERLQLATETQVKVNDKAEAEIDSDWMSQLSSSERILKKCVKSVKLKCEGYEIESVTDLEMFDKGMVISNRLLEICIGGIPLGKRLNAS